MTIHTINGTPIMIGQRVWYAGCKDVSYDNRAGPSWRDHPSRWVTVEEMTDRKVVIRFDTPEKDEGGRPVETTQVGVFTTKDGKKYAGSWGTYGGDGLPGRCNFFGLFDSKEKSGVKWPS